MRTLLALLLTALGLSSAAMAAGHPTPAEAGFHHCVLIYDRDTRKPGDLAHYVARTGSGRSEWLFDAFLFLIQNSARDIRTEYGETRKVDWQYQLDRWFDPSRDLASLNAAIEQASKRLGPPPVKRRVILSIPYPNRHVTDFGDVDGDGKSEDLSTPEGRKAVLAWYMGAATELFRSAGYRHLDLWGFYWMREDMEPGDEEAIRAASDLAHARAKRLLWIPYFRSPGWDRWKESGIDVAILQPNYAFSTPQFGGRAGRSRLGITAELAHSKGLGVEIEAFDVVNNASARRVFLHYLSDGHALGYQKGANGFFLSTDILEQIATSKDPQVRRGYDALADYVAGRPVPDPDLGLKWTWGESGGARMATATLPGNVPVSAVEVFLKEPDTAWRGTIEVSARRNASGAWEPGGWALRTARDLTTGAWQLVRVPVERQAGALRVTFRPEKDSPPLRITRITVDPHGPVRERHAALFRPYRITPAPAGQYPDNGNELTDGRIPEGGFPSGGTVGWQGGGTVAVSFDLGRVMPVEGIEVHAQGGSVAAVNWPAQAIALLAAGAQTQAGFSGLGKMPAGFSELRGGPVVVDRRRSETDMDGHIAITPKAPVPARYVTVLLEGNGWLMLSEVKVFSGGRNVAPDAAYTLRPLPSGGGDSPYADDGVRLTDGIVARSFVTSEITGWQGKAPYEVVVDLGAARLVHRITVWSLRGGRHGIFGPKEVSLETSADGTSWALLGPAKGPTGPEDGGALASAPYRLDAPSGTSARFVRAHITGSGEWTMFSEVEVE